MKLVIGLGNPGEKFRNNRHNVGQMFIDFAGLGEKTDCFMNDSGKFVQEKVNFFKVGLEDLYVVHDDLDIILGEYKIQFGVGPKIHYGVQSVEKELGTKDFWRIRIGVDARDPNDREPGESYVLKDFSAHEREILKGVFDEITRQHPWES